MSVFGIREKRNNVSWECIGAVKIHWYAELRLVSHYVLCKDQDKVQKKINEDQHADVVKKSEREGDML